MDRALEFAEARRIVIETVRPMVGRRPLETVGLEDGYGRILAEPLNAERDYPALARSLLYPRHACFARSRVGSRALSLRPRPPE